MFKINWTTYRRKTKGDLKHTYAALNNLIDSNNQIKDFNVSNFKMGDLRHHVNIDCQPSYDGTVNLILNDDVNPPKIVNTRFSKLEDNKFKVITRSQENQTNLYKENNVDVDTRLLKSSDIIPKIDLDGVYNSGTLKGGTYTFFICLADEDGNKTDILSESGQILIYKGTANKISSIVGTTLNEITDKTITLRISDIDRSYSRIYLYYTREYCDDTGNSLVEVKKITEPYRITARIESISITGYEATEDIPISDLNINYNVITAAKTQAQVQNMLFFGNVQQTDLDVSNLQNLAYYIKVTLKQSKESIGWIDPCTYTIKDNEDLTKSEYYSPNNIYYKLGYWPDEIYRLGIVYIMNDNTLSPVFPLRGCEFGAINACNLSEFTEIKNLEKNSYLNTEGWLSNTFGVFKLPKETTKTCIINYNDKTVKPWYFSIEIPQLVKNSLKSAGVKGYIIVRQKRLANTLCQGLSLGVDKESHIPMLYNTEEKQFFTESFLSAITEYKTESGIKKAWKISSIASILATAGASLAKSGAALAAGKYKKTVENIKPTLTSDLSSRILTAKKSKGSALLSLDVDCIPELKSKFDGSSFILSKSVETSLSADSDEERHFYTMSGKQSESSVDTSSSVTYIPEDTSLKYMNGYSFSSKCGAAEDVSKFSFFEDIDWDKDTNKLLRGQWTSYLGINDSLDPNCIYSIKIPGYTQSKLKNYFEIRKNDNSPFYAISDRKIIGEEESIDVYRGDCYTSTITIRLNRNFVDSDVPICDVIIDNETWYKNYKGYSNMVNGWNASTKGEKKSDSVGDYTDINRADVNAVPLGMWVTYKCLSNYNIGIRSIDYSHSDEQALLGNPRGFYPNSGFNITSSGKMPESKLFNQGYSKTVCRKENFLVPNVPYIKDLFDNRIMFSDVQTFGKFENSFRIFKSLDYQDIDRQYGAIVKLEPWNSNLLCVFEHGIGLIAVNDQALLSTQSGQSIHMYGAGVLQNKINVISSDFGSIWPESIIRTPAGLYGVDTTAKKIWRVNYKNQIELISDMKIQHYLNEHINLKEKDKYEYITLKNVKSHFNNYKGDVMFTFYNEDEEWNLCYNERIGNWVTRYSWIPLCSENIDNIFYSLDRNKAKNQALLSCSMDSNCNISVDNSVLSVSDNSTILHLNDIVNDSVAFTLNSVVGYYTIDNNLYSEPCDELFKINSNTLLLNNEFINTDGEYKSISFKVNGVTPVFYKLEILATSTYGDISTITKSNIYIKLSDVDLEQENFFFTPYFYVHGRSGSFDEMDYNNEILGDQILPTKWYDKQEPFEFEFVVNEPAGMHKIFDNLIIISNNVAPKELEFEVLGDSYGFNKKGIYWKKEWEYAPSVKENCIIKDGNSLRIGMGEKSVKKSQQLENAEIVWDTTLNQYSIRTAQPCKDINLYGRRLGNIQYKEDAWYSNIEPISYKKESKVENQKEVIAEDSTTVKLRDKYCKIRVKYSGNDLAVISSLITMYTQSYA